MREHRDATFVAAQGPGRQRLGVPHLGPDDTARPVVADPGAPTRPFLDFGAGYIRRVLDQLPRQGERAPWLTSMSYFSDVKLLRRLPVEDDELQFSRSRDSVNGPRGVPEKRSCSCGCRTEPCRTA